MVHSNCGMSIINQNCIWEAVYASYACKKNSRGGKGERWGYVSVRMGIEFCAPRTPGALP